jgi:phospholipid transport system substrate-binding protein
MTDLLRRIGFAQGALAALCIVAGLMAAAPAAEADPAVQHMERVAKDVMAAARARAPQPLQNAVGRHADVNGLGLYALGDYRNRLEPADRESYFSGMVRFIGRYAAGEAPKYPVARVDFQPASRPAKYGLMVDSTVVLEDGSSYEVSWLLVKSGNSYRIRDAQAMGIWLSPFLKKLFEDYIAQNGNSVKALVTVLQRH